MRSPVSLSAVKLAPARLRTRQGRKDPYPVDDEFTQTVPRLPLATVPEDIDVTEELPVLEDQSARDINQYAEAFLRYYRVRKILSGNRNIRTVTRERARYAWQYLATVAPQDLPEILRQPHREIEDLASQLNRENKSHPPVEFVSKVLDAATFIDQILDDLLTDTEEPV